MNIGTWLRGARLADGTPADVHIEAGRITDVVRDPPATTTGDLDGYVLLPSFVEPHAHLDKALTAARVPNPAGDLRGAIEAMAAAAGSFSTADIAARADAALRVMLAHGTTAVRTHVDVGTSTGMRAVAALADVRERWAGTVDVQVVALVGRPWTGRAAPTCARRCARGRTSPAAARTWTRIRTARSASAWTSPVPRGRRSTCTPTRRSTRPC
ncbi:hypothetical protein [Phytohabitans rumicis]|uniref:Amidohydrolase 3 domain-containing protein n=1 Tax=Phytohabitans rumicis TaxID=1076125 RepID=A0A6V8KXY7_9ACTN|nr:hypothetical protein [Phytohabitans rumicis]GFJ87189.1 hypothetical protein Prum_008310 [Phytohabitans rumicis]